MSQFAYVRGKAQADVSPQRGLEPPSLSFGHVDGSDPEPLFRGMPLGIAGMRIDRRPFPAVIGVEGATRPSSLSVCPLVS